MRFSGVLTAAAIVLTASHAAARENIRVQGSAAVFQRAQALAARFEAANPGASVDVVGGGTSAGLRAFCAGMGVDYVDIAMTTRFMNERELGECASSGVQGGPPALVVAGYASFVLVYGDDGPRVNFSVGDLYRAFAADLVVDERPTPNPFRSWSQVNPALPDADISLLIPWDRVFNPVFLRNMLIKGCRQVGDHAFYRRGRASERDADVTCGAVRTDGPVFNVTGDYSDIERELGADMRAIGLMSFEHFRDRSSDLRAASIGGFTATRSVIMSGEYPFSDALYFYVKREHLRVIPGLEEFRRFVISEVASFR